MNAQKISLDYFKVFPGQGEAVEKIDDRDPRIQYGSMFKNWSDAELYASTEKYADINANDSLASEATATNSILWNRYPNLWIKKQHH